MCDRFPLWQRGSLQIPANNAEKTLHMYVYIMVCYEPNDPLRGAAIGSELLAGF